MRDDFAEWEREVSGSSWFDRYLRDCCCDRPYAIVCPEHGSELVR